MSQNPPRPRRSILAKAFADPRTHELQNRSQRVQASRTFAAWSLLLPLWLSLFLSGTAESWFVRNITLPDTIATIVTLAALLVFLAFWMLSLGLLNASIGGITELKTDDIDEAQRSLRDAAYHRSHGVSFAIALTLFLIGVSNAAWLTPPVLTGVGFALLITLRTLPIHILAWTLPDSDEQVAKP